jgi:hypothetical protein
MRRSIYRILGIAALLALTGCTVYAEPARPVVYYGPAYYAPGPDVVVYGGYYHGGYYRHYR